MVFNMKTNDLAEYLSSAKIEIKINEAEGFNGRRINRANRATSYKIDINTVTLDKPICPHITAFINSDDSIILHIGIDEIKYTLQTTELSPAYGKGGHLNFRHVVEPFEMEYAIPKQELSKYEQFKTIRDEVIDDIIGQIHLKMEEFDHQDEDGATGWDIEGFEDVALVFSTYAYNE